MTSRIAYNGRDTTLSVTATNEHDDVHSLPHQRCEVSLRSALPFLLSRRKTSWIETKDERNNYVTRSTRISQTEGLFSSHNDGGHSSSGRKRQRVHHPPLNVIDVQDNALKKKHEQPLQYPIDSPLVVETSPGVRVSICSLAGGGKDEIVLIREERHTHRDGTGNDKHRRELIVQNCAGFLAADLCGIGAFEQILLFARSSDRSGRDAKTQLQALIQGCIITDGEDIFHSAIAFEKISLSDGAVASLGEDKQVLTRRCRLQEPAIETLRESCDAVLGATTTTNAFARQKESTKVRSTWQATVEKALGSSIQYQSQQLTSKEELLDQQRLLLESGRSTLQQLSSTPESASDLQLLRLSYSSRPQLGAGADKFSTLLLIEADLQLQNDSTGKTTDLRQFHLSLTHTSGSRDQMAITSRSGVAERFDTHTRATVIVAASLENIDLESIAQGIHLNLHALWKSNDGDEKRQGIVLSRFLVLRTHFLVASANHIVHENAFTAPDNLTSAVVYECRKPHLLEVNISSCLLEVPALIRNMNNSLSGTLSRVDLISSSVDSLTLALFAFPPSTAPLLTTLIQDLVPNRNLLSSE